MSISVNDKVPNFSLPSTTGENFVLENYIGKKVILYFYPKDNTPGCTLEAIDFTNNLEKFDSFNALVFGISKDNIPCHNKFSSKHNLSFTLLSDEDASIQKMFDVLKLKNVFGKEHLGTVRSTFIINEEGILIREYRNVKVKHHVSNILKFLNELGK